MNRNHSSRFWLRVNYLGLLAFAIAIALVCVKMLSIGLSVLFRHCPF